MENKNMANGKWWWLKVLVAGVSCTTVIGAFTGGLYHTKYTASQALAKAEENGKILMDRTAVVNSVPHVEKKVDAHIEDFREFKGEYKSDQRENNRKLDIILQRSMSRGQ